VSAAFVEDRIVVRIPAGIEPAGQEEAITSIVAKVVRRHRAQRVADDGELLRRAHRLADRYLDGVRPVSVAWSGRMQRRHGSCSTHAGTIRLSVELAEHPDYVLDAVLVHELAHLLEPNHSPAFHALANRYPDQRRADAYLEGFAAGRFARARAADA
jgi:predicted metal-dependent hydrolase